MRYFGEVLVLKKSFKVETEPDGWIAACAWAVYGCGVMIGGAVGAEGGVGAVLHSAYWGGPGVGMQCL